MKKYPITQTNKVVRGPKRASYDKEAVDAILDDGFVCFVSYVYDNQAISIPMAYGKKEDSLLLHGSLKNRMLQSLLKTDKASITVMHLDGLVLARSAFHHSVNYRSVTLFGVVEEVIDEKEKIEALECIVNQMIPDRWNDLRPITQKEINSTLVVKFSIQTASAKCREEGVVDNKEDLDFPVWAGIIPVQQIALTPVADDKLITELEIPNHVTNYVNSHNL